MSSRKTLALIALLCLALFITAAKSADQPQPGGSSPSPGKSLDVKDLSLDQAHAVLAAAVKQAQELKINQNVAVVDSGGSLKAFARMDNAWLGSIDIAIKKAKTAR